MHEDQKSNSPLPWILLGIIILVLGAVAIPFALRQKIAAEHTKAISNLRQISLAMLEFEQSFGAFPDESTAEIINKRSATAPRFDTSSSNGCFSQLLAADMVNYRGIFYAKTAYTKKPDPSSASSKAPLAPGEVGYGYLLKGKAGLSSAENPARPILCAPLAYDGHSVSDRLFDPDIYQGNAVLLRLDGSVQSARIDPTTKNIMLSNGRTLLDTGPDTVWGTKTTPVIVPPLPLNR